MTLYRNTVHKKVSHAVNVRAVQIRRRKFELTYTVIVPLTMLIMYAIVQYTMVGHRKSLTV